MKNVSGLIALLLLLATGLNAQNRDFEIEKPVKNLKATVKMTDNGELFLLIPDSDANMRYISRQLPEEYKKDGLKVKLTGWEGKIPPNVRMMGKPLKITSICVSKSEQKKFKLKRTKYSFK